MIQIIKMGRIPQDAVKYQTTCNYCSTVFEYDKTDIRYIQNGLDIFYYGYITCPLCKIHCSTIKTIKD